MQRTFKLQLNRETVRQLDERELGRLQANGASGGTCPYCAIDQGWDTAYCSKAVIGTCYSYAQYCGATDYPGCG